MPFIQLRNSYSVEREGILSWLVIRYGPEDYITVPAVENEENTIYYYYLFTAIGFAPGGSSPTLVQKKS
jgi:hypothetical protein